MPAKIYPPIYLLVLCVAVVSGCYSKDPNANPKALGSLDVTTNEQGNICLKPLLDSAKIDGDNTFKTNFITHVEASITLDNTPLDASSDGSSWIASFDNPKQSISQHDIICVNQTNPPMKHTHRHEIKANNIYTAVLWGTSENGKHHVVLTKRFYYHANNQMEYVSDNP